MEEAKIEKKIKKNKNKNKVASLLLALALILTCGVAGTIAQYQKSFNGNATATVAKFNVTDNNSVQTNITNLFKTVVDTEAGVNSDYAESDVASGTIAPGTAGFVKLEVQNDSEVSIDYTFALEKLYKSGTGAGQAGNGWEINYKASASAQQNTLGEIPLKFALYKGTKDLSSISTAQKGQEIAGIASSDWKDLSSLSANDLKGTIKVTDSDQTKNVYLVWQWAFGTDGADDATNRLDTAIGEDMAGSKTINPQLKVTLTAKQVD